jgi:hypothetical protein
MYPRNRGLSKGFQLSIFISRRIYTVLVNTSGSKLMLVPHYSIVLMERKVLFSSTLPPAGAEFRPLGGRRAASRTGIYRKSHTPYVSNSWKLVRNFVTRYTAKFGGFLLPLTGHERAKSEDNWGLPSAWIGIYVFRDWPLPDIPVLRGTCPSLGIATDLREKQK